MKSKLYNGLSLTTIVTRLHKIAMYIDHAYDELDAFHAPSECGGLIDRAYAKDVDNIIKSAGFADLDELFNEIRDRTSYKWAYLSGVGCLPTLDSFRGRVAY
jgi:hypothetical protein